MTDLDRLRDLAREPERTAMPRTGQFPSMTAQLLRNKQETDVLRRGLNEAIAEIEAWMREVEIREITIAEQSAKIEDQENQLWSWKEEADAR